MNGFAPTHRSPSYWVIHVGRQNVIVPTLMQTCKLWTFYYVHVEIQSCSPFSTLIPISSIVLKMPKKSFYGIVHIRNRLSVATIKVYNFLLNKMKRICFRFQIWTCMESCHELHKGVTLCHSLNVKRDR